MAHLSLAEYQVRVPHPIAVSKGWGAGITTRSRHRFCLQIYGDGDRIVPVPLSHKPRKATPEIRTQAYYRLGCMGRVDTDKSKLARDWISCCPPFASSKGWGTLSRFGHTSAEGWATRRRGINQHTLEKILRRETVRTIKLTHCLRVLEQYESEPDN